MAPYQVKPSWDKFIALFNLPSKLKGSSKNTPISSLFGIGIVLYCIEISCKIGLVPNSTSALLG